MGREPFERVGACQTLACRTAPTALEISSIQIPTWKREEPARLEMSIPAPASGVHVACLDL
jgi:hypothetical protein